MNRISRRRFLATTALGAGGGLALPRCSSTPPIKKPKHVFIISLDTLRADHLSCYGYPRNTSPFLDDLAKRSVLCEHALTSCNHTNPAHVSLFTGLHIPQHKVYTNSHLQFDERLPQLPKMFEDLGYETAAFCSIRWLRVLEHSFQRWNNHKRWDPPSEEPPPGYRQGHDTVAALIQWLEKRPIEKPSFSWLHLFDPHTPYYPPDAIQKKVGLGFSKERKKLLHYWTKEQDKNPQTNPYFGEEAFIEAQNAYDAEIAYVDQQLSRLFEAADKLGYYKDSLWILTADHGEGMGQHNFSAHGLYIYQEEIRVPLLIHDPSGALKAGRVPEICQHVDLFPTLAEMMGEKMPVSPLSMPGTSLLPVLQNRGNAMKSRYLYCQRHKRYFSGITANWEKGPIYCLSNGVYKYIARPNQQDELYVLRDDPLERYNRIADFPRIKENLRRKADRYYLAMAKEAEGIKEFGPKADSVLEDQEQLGALGYL